MSLNKTVSILKSISDRNRLRILCALLVHEELCACQITEFLQVAGATASRHLGLMVNAGILKNRKQGRWIYFCLNKEDRTLDPVFEWIETKTKGAGQVEKDLTALKRILQIPCEELSQKQRAGGTCASE